MFWRRMAGIALMAALGITAVGGLGMNNCGAEAVREPHMVDGPGMANTNLWKHQVLDGQWMAPEGDLALVIRSFDFEFGRYKAGEPDNFRWHKDRFYFAGWQNSEDRAARFDLMLNGEPKITDQEGKVLLSLAEMWHEKKSIFVKVQFPGEKDFKIRELRKPETFVE